jgi:hypothetical protein
VTRGPVVALASLLRLPFLLENGGSFIALGSRLEKKLLRIRHRQRKRQPPVQTPFHPPLCFLEIALRGLEVDNPRQHFGLLVLLGE